MQLVLLEMTMTTGKIGQRCDNIKNKINIPKENQKNENDEVKGRTV